MGPPHSESPSLKTYTLLRVQLFGITFKQLFDSSEISFMGWKVFPVLNYLDFSWIMHFSKTQFAD